MQEIVTQDLAHTVLPRLMRKHIPSGNVSEAQWSAAQHTVLGDPLGYPARTLDRVCRELVAKWNRQQPDTWEYWLEARFGV